MTVYPAQIDTNATLPSVIDNLTPVQGVVYNRLRDTIIEIEEELGIKPSGLYSTVRARFDAIEKNFVTIGGDIGGTSTSPLVIGIQGRSVSSAQPNVGDALLWSGSSWIPHSLPSGGSGDGYVVFSGDLSGTIFIQAVIGLQGRAVSNTAPSVGQPLTWNGTAWAPSSTINVVIETVANISNSNYTVPSTNSGTLVSMTGLTVNRSVFLPPSPIVGQKITVKDADGSLVSHNIVINGNGHNIDDAATYTLSNIQGPRSALSVQYNGSIWCIV